MQRRKFLTGAAGLVLAAAPMVTAGQGATHMTKGESGRFAVAGLDLHYEIHGSGEPLVLLHGGISVRETLGQTLPELAKSYRVIVPHMQGHGLTSDIDRPLSYERMAADVVALLRHLGIGKADIVGYSMGAGVAMQVAFGSPGLIRKLVVVSATYARDGWYPEVVQAFLDMPANAPVIAAGMRKSPLAEAYPNVDWETLFRKVGEMESLPFDWSADVAAIEAPTMLVFADADAIRPEHIVDFYQRLGGFLKDGGLDGSGRPPGQLAIIPGTTHYNLNEGTAVAAAILPFLGAPLPAGPART